MSYEYLIAKKYLLSKNKHSFLNVISLISVAGVSIGVMALIIVLSVLSGFQEDFKKKILGNNAPLLLFHADGSISDKDGVLKTLDQLEGVKGASAFVVGEVLLVSDLGKSGGAVIYGVDPERAVKVISIEEDLVEGDLSKLNATQSGLPGIILGKTLAKEQLLASLGSSVSVVSPKGEMSPFGYAPKIRKFEVVGIFKSGLHEYDSKSAYIDLQTSQQFFEEGQQVKGIQIAVDDENKAWGVAAKVSNALGNNYFVRHWMELNKDFFNALKLEKTVFFIVVVLIVLVAALNIVSTLTLLVLTKVKEISILKAMGASSSSVAKIFIYVGTTIGFIGTLIGVFLGLLGCFILKEYVPFPLDANVYQIDHLPIRIDMVEIFTVGVAAFLISFLSTIYPAMHAAYMETSKGIRNE